MISVLFLCKKLNYQLETDLVCTVFNLHLCWQDCGGHDMIHVRHCKLILFKLGKTEVEGKETNNEAPISGSIESYVCREWITNMWKVELHWTTTHATGDRGNLGLVLFVPMTQHWDRLKKLDSYTIWRCLFNYLSGSYLQSHHKILLYTCKSQEIIVVNKTWMPI